MRHILAVICSVLLTQAILLLASRYFVDIWHLAIFYSAALQLGLATLAASLLVFALWRGRFQFALMLAAAGLSAHAYLMLGEFSHTAAADARPALRLVTFNILGSNMKNGAAIADRLIASQADVLFLQESAAIGPQIPRLRAVYPFRLGCGAGTITCDLSLWSKHPLVDGRVETISPLYRDRFMTATILVDGVPVHLMTAHMAKPYFDETHAVEMKRLTEEITSTKGPLVLGGDFNASTIAPDVQKMLRQTGLRSAAREPATWPVRAVSLGVAIDHVYVRAPLAISAIERLEKSFGSNHFGLSAELSFNP